MRTHRLTTHATAARQGGFTLLEVMVAIVILSFGMLGVAGLMITGLQFTHSAQQRTIATQLAYDMIDRMRSNQAGVALADNPAGGGNYHRPIGDVAGIGSPYIIAKPACIGATAAAAGCAPGDMADQDSFEWQQAIRQRLANGVAIICRNSLSTSGTYDGTTIVHGCDGVGPKYTIKIYWRDDRSDAAHSSGTAQYQAFMTTFIP